MASSVWVQTMTQAFWSPAQCSFYIILSVDGMSGGEGTGGFEEGELEYRIPNSKSPGELFNNRTFNDVT